LTARAEEITPRWSEFRELRLDIQGNALQFNGSSGRMEIKAPAADFRFTTAFTVSAWVNPATLPTGWHVIAARQIGAATTDTWFLGHNGPTLYFSAGAVVSTTLTAGQWTHIAAVKNGTTVAIYLNGTLAASSNTAQSPLATDANEVGSAPVTMATRCGESSSTGGWTTCGSTRRHGPLRRFWPT
jgi:hypothetical protein